MRSDDFFIEQPHEPDPWGLASGSRKVLNTELLSALRRPKAMTTLKQRSP
ncbi:hypothetical protein [Actinomadura macrotermitis]|uniref:Uncharacterized protein n=1 Tax=Actinomadura macrotermitis TaxID=2585200 RepID=A0A7K0C914_9ACTN|nr:hypothetical protein [Actinomadura macrotermitis]MQY09284.1 hypothetical protein [Actinomadura macrotermitis]